jgi:hypothetical protein
MIKYHGILVPASALTDIKMRPTMKYRRTKKQIVEFKIRRRVQIKKKSHPVASRTEKMTQRGARMTAGGLRVSWGITGPIFCCFDTYCQSFHHKYRPRFVS